LRREVSGAGIAMQKRLVAETGQFILSRIDACHGAFGIIPSSLDGSLVSNDFPVFVINSSRILPEFLGWLSRTNEFIKICKNSSEGTTNRKRLVIDRFLSTPIPLPDLDKQRCVAEHLNTLSSDIAEVQTLQQKNQKEVEALKLCVNYSLFIEQRTKDWSDRSIEDCCETLIDYRGRTPPVIDEGIPHITSANIRDGRIEWRTEKYVDLEIYNKYMTRGIPRMSDVLFTMEAPLGETAVITENRRFSLAQRILLLRPRLDIISGEYLAKVLMSPTVREAIGKKATRTTVTGISSKRLRKILLPIPPLKKQHHIVAILDDLQLKIDSLRKMHIETSEYLDSLLPSLLSKAFRGEIC
jgi:type I restriction enzyme S subunit